MQIVLSRPRVNGVSVIDFDTVNKLEAYLEAISANPSETKIKADWEKNKTSMLSDIEKGWDTSMTVRNNETGKITATIVLKN